jgi:hypothetical protein
MMMKRIFFIVVWCLFASVAFGQMNVRDSILGILNNETIDLNIRHNQAYRVASNTKDDAVIAYFYQEYAHLHLRKGSIEIALEYVYKAITLYESLKLYDRVANNLYRLAETFLQIRDIDGLRTVIKQMQRNIEQQWSVSAAYSLYAVQVAYYAILSEEYPENKLFNDSALLASRNTIYLIENHTEELPRNVVISWDYYNMSITYERVYPDHYDSIYYFLDKTLETRYLIDDETIQTEIEISVYISYAEYHFEQKNYKQAEKDMLYVLSLLEQIQDYNTVIVEYSEAYKFLITYYEKMNRPWDVVKYQKLLLENEQRRYNNDKILAKNEMSARYETEKKEIQIQTLIKEKETARRILWLTFGLSFMLLMASFLIIWSSRLKRKNIEQRLYETALQAELRQNELERIQNSKQQLEQNPVKNSVERISQMVSDSLIEKDMKVAYLERLSKIDTQLLENAYQTSKIKITSMDMKYIICFAADLDTKDISLIFNIEPASVNTVRYRIKKKFSKEDSFRMIL